MLASFALLLTGCSRSADAASGGAGGVVTGRVTPGGQASGHPQMVRPSPGMMDVHPVRFTEATPVGDGRILQVRFWSGKCDGLDHLSVQESNTQVKVTLFVGADPAQTGPCPQLAVLRAVDVQLSRPLGDRKIVDGAPRGSGPEGPTLVPGSSPIPPADG